MAITFDAPSTNWATASRVSAEPRVVYPIAFNTSAIHYEVSMVQNQCNFTPLALGTVMATTTLDGGITSATTTVTVDSTADFPCAGSFKVDAETIAYTGRTATTFTGCTVVSSHSDGATVDSIAILTAETTPAPNGALVEWARTFSTVPNDWVSYSEGVFTFPGYYNDVYHANYRCPQALNVTIKTTTTYKNTTDPYADLDVANQMFRVIDADSCVLDYVDGATTPTYATYTGYVSGGTLIYAAQSTLQRYVGNIWARMDHQTKAQ